MRWSDIPLAPTSKTLRQFAALWILFFGGFAAWHGLMRDRPVLASLLAILAATVGPLGLLNPRTIRPIYLGWMMAAFPIGWVVSQVLLFVIFFGLFTPLALFFRLTGRDVLRLRHRPDQTTYWSGKEMSADVGGYFRQF